MNCFRFPAPVERARRGGAVFKGRCSSLLGVLNQTGFEDMGRIGTGMKWLRDSMAYIPDIREIYANEKRGDWPAYLPGLLPGA